MAKTKTQAPEAAPEDDQPSQDAAPVSVDHLHQAQSLPELPADMAEVPCNPVGIHLFMSEDRRVMRVCLGQDGQVYATPADQPKED